MVLNENLKIPSTRDLFIALRYRETRKSKTPLEKWCHLYGIGRFVAKLPSSTAFIDDQTLNWFIYCSIVFTIYYLCLTIYTAYYISNGEPFKCLPYTLDPFICWPRSVGMIFILVLLFTCVFILTINFIVNACPLPRSIDLSRQQTKCRSKLL